MIIKTLIKSLLPELILKNILKLNQYVKYNEYRKLSSCDIFSKIYKKGVWGISVDPLQPFFSGGGSRDDLIIAPYIKTIKNFILQLKTKPSVVDLGCGDFFVGSQIREYCGEYTACDIVPEIIEYNKEKFKSLNVEFKVLDLALDSLPCADIVIIRQVLQHLNNKQILQFIPKITKYKYAIVTEHLPSLQSYEHNIDKLTGPNTRLELRSGVILTSPPFNLIPYTEQKLCEVKENDSFITTTLYQISNNL